MANTCKAGVRFLFFLFVFWAPLVPLAFYLVVDAPVLHRPILVSPMGSPLNPFANRPAFACVTPSAFALALAVALTA